MLLHEGKNYDTEAFPTIVNIIDIPNDWNATPIVSITVKDQSEVCDTD
jgi:hypothetical protein